MRVLYQLSYVGAMTSHPTADRRPPRAGPSYQNFTRRTMLGAVVANGMFALAAISISSHHRASAAHLFSEVIATAGPLLVIFSLARTRRLNVAPAAVGAYIGAAFIHQLRQLRQPGDQRGPHVLQYLRRIAPASVPGFIVAQLLGRACAILVIRALYLDVTPAEAAEVVLPHHQSSTDGSISQPAPRAS
jgi:glycerol uptake facilitator-like aquaporin